MARPDKCYTILMADDDLDDYLLVRDALSEVGRRLDLRVVRDGEQLCDYLFRRGEYANGQISPRPDLILLDMRMPKKDGRDVLREVKGDPKLRRIPIVALTTSTAVDDISFSYDMGVNSYVTKPTTYRELVRMVGLLVTYWFDIAELPPKD